LKAFFVIVLVTNWHGHVTHSTQQAGWMIAHQCHLQAYWIEEQHPGTVAECRIEHHH